MRPDTGNIKATPNLLVDCKIFEENRPIWCGGRKIDRQGHIISA